MAVFQVHVWVLQHFAHGPKIDLVSPTNMTKFRTKPGTNNLYGGLITLQDIEVHLAAEKQVEQSKSWNSLGEKTNRKSYDFRFSSTPGCRSLLSTDPRDRETRVRAC